MFDLQVPGSQRRLGPFEDLYWSIVHLSSRKFRIRNTKVVEWVDDIDEVCCQ